MSSVFSYERIARAARIYTSNNDAALALGIAPGSFGRLCRRYGIETPSVRKKREGREFREEAELRARERKECHPWRASYPDPAAAVG